MSDEYAGDLSPRESWDLLQEDKSAVIVDVRTDAEFAYVGGPDPDAMKNTFLKISWITFPGMDRNPHFEDAVRDAVPDKDTPILFLCRSGQRSASAAKALTALGYTRCYNIAEGFEGDKDADKHRGTVNGWKVRGLPWVQG
ncbi:MAG: rhodanese-like domain-containing protein [Rhodospirillales bacterium]|nr:rhodanese-like domain-containing protein [Rhodospirillales bacterium]MBO6788542.1 rhodanese-like domain-containing protein [Rhodospirillales bacterium]